MAVINPEIFCEPGARKAVRRVLHNGLAQGDRLAYLKAAEQAQPREPNAVPLDSLEQVSHFQAAAQAAPIEEHRLVLDDPGEPLEPVYFYLLDDLEARDGWRVEKLVDTVSATPGSGLSLDLNRRLTQQQQDVAKTLIQIHKTARELVARWQKWRTQKQQLEIYERSRSSELEVREGALRQLKRQWQKEAEDRMITPEPFEVDERAFDFWLTHSESELRQRMAVDRGVLRAELNLIKLQVNGVRPQLQANQESGQGSKASLVTAFNTALLELVLLVAPLSDLEQAVAAGELPETVLRPRYRRCWPIVIISLRVRAIPERSNRGGYGYRGQVELRFRSYAVNEEELAVLRRELQRSEWGDVLGVVEQGTARELEALLGELDDLLLEHESTPIRPESGDQDPNPFAALWSCLDWFRTEPPAAQPPVLIEPLRPDKDLERALRSFALIEGRGWCRELYQQQKRWRHLPGWDD